MGYWAKDGSYVRDDDDIKVLEAQVRRPNYGPTGLHPDRTDIDHMTSDQMKVFEAQVREMKETDASHIKYLKSLLVEPKIKNEKEFEEAVNRSMKSNRIMDIFYRDFIEKLSEKIVEFNNLGYNNPQRVNSLKLEIEQLVEVYERYLYKLKENGWDFRKIEFDARSSRIPEEIEKDLWQIQKKYNFTFDMLIPADLGEDYGNKFERTGKMIPGLFLVYEDLSGKDVQWHAILNYRQNELTPYQRFKLRQEEKRKKFEQARQEEIAENLNNLQQKNTSIGSRK